VTKGRSSEDFWLNKERGRAAGARPVLLLCTSTALGSWRTLNSREREFRGHMVQRGTDRDLDTDTSVLSMCCWRYLFDWTVPLSVVSSNVFIYVHIHCFTSV